MAWKHIGLTCAQYQEGDLIGKLLAYSSITPVYIVVAFVTLIFFKRDVHTIFYFLGILLNELCNSILKNVIGQSRPVEVSYSPTIYVQIYQWDQVYKELQKITKLPAQHALHGEYGMPSSHAQFMCFFAMYFTLFLWIRIHSLSFGYRDTLWRSIATFLVQSITIIVCVSRVYLNYHTASQVMWGALIGIINGSCWFTIVQFLLTPLFPDIVCNPIGEFFMLRDCTLIPNILWFEYTSLKSEAKTRLRKIR